MSYIIIVNFIVDFFAINFWIKFKTSKKVLNIGSEEDSAQTMWDLVSWFEIF